ncbi:MAG: signal recognition particle-docking protein FtsY [Pseudomonadota bacterium]
MTTPSEPGNSLFQRLKTGLTRTRDNFNDGLADLLLGEKPIDDDLLDDLETTLLTADIGLETTRQLIDELQAQVQRRALSNRAALYQALQARLIEILQQTEQPVPQPDPGQPLVILLVGINGAGKTTTIGKLAHRYQQAGNKVMLAAGDTFRAAAVEQLQNWGQQNDVPVISQGQGADAASVIFDALQAAQARRYDVLIADTAGRLHTKNNLMDELTKIVRVLKKQDPQAPHEIMLVVDAGTGQNALHQAREFHRAVGLTSIALTKLDGTAKGGIVFTIADQLPIPIRYVGIGEGIHDLRPFAPEAFVQALFEGTPESVASEAKTRQNQAVYE